MLVVSIVHVAGLGRAVKIIRPTGLELRVRRRPVKIKHSTAHHLVLSNAPLLVIHTYRLIFLVGRHR